MNDAFGNELEERLVEFEEMLNSSSQFHHEENFPNEQNNQFQNQYFTAPNEEQVKYIWTCQMNEYYTLMDTKIDTKNIPKTFGNYFKKYCTKIKQNNPTYRLPQGVIDFMSKKPPAKQSTYGLEDFRQLCQSSQEAKQLFYYYTTNCLYLDLLHSNRVKDPLEYINFIEQYAAGSQAPQKLISSRKFNPIQKTICKRQSKKSTKK